MDYKEYYTVNLYRKFLESCWTGDHFAGWKKKQQTFCLYGPKTVALLKTQ